MRRILLFIIVNVAVFCTLIVFIEITGQALYYLRHGKFIYQTNDTRNIAIEYQANVDVFELHPYLVGRLRKNIIVERNSKTIKSTDRYTRWTGSPQNDDDLIRVAVIGGSTAFGTGVTDSDSWPALLQSRLGDGFSVVNFGVPGYTTAEAIIQMALIVPEIKPDFIIIYEGWNDIHNYHVQNLGSDYYQHGMKLYENLVIPIKEEDTLFDKLYGLSAIVRFAATFKTDTVKHSDGNSRQTYDTSDPFVDRMYVRNLNTLKLLSEHIALYTLFVPQVLNYQWFLDQKDQNDGAGWAKHITNRSMPHLMDRFNSLMEPVCPKEDKKCVFVGEVLNVEWKPDDFIDDGHFSKKGGEKFADIISKVILTKAKEFGLYDD